MVKIIGFLRFVTMEFGAIIVFWVGLYSFGLKPAIAATIAFILLDALYRIWRKLAVTRLYVMVSCMTLVFGAIDLYAATPFMLKYEAVITNIATGLFFVAGARGKKSLIEELAEKRGSFPERPDVKYFFKLFTLFWAAYFFLKAALYLWLGAVLPLEQALAWRALLGGVSLAIMGGLSLMGRKLFFFCRWLNILPQANAAGATRADN